MKTAFWARRAHKWIALVVGVQALLWMLSGLYMTVISIDIIHGDHLAHADAATLDEAAPRIDQSAIAARFPAMTGLKLKRLLDREVFEVRTADTVALVDAGTGQRLDPLDEATARRLAVALYQGEGKISTAEWLDEAPGEVATRPVPMWRVSFDDGNETALYLSPFSGELLAKRHDLWRWFDFLWMLHIMDYETRSDVNNTLFRVAASIGTLFALSGIWLLFYSFTRERRA